MLGAYSPTGPAESFINFLDARTCELIRTHRLGARGFLSFSWDGTAMLTWPHADEGPLSKKGFELWRLSGKDVRSGSPIQLSSPGLTKPPGSRVLSSTRNETRTLFETDDGGLGVWGQDGDSLVLLEASRNRGRQGIRSYVFSANGTRVATLSGRQVRVWDARSGKFLVTFECDADPNSHEPVSLSPDGSKLIVASRDHAARIYPTTPEGFLGVARRLLGR